MSQIPTITLHDGVEIPQLGFGTFQIPADETTDIVLTAFEASYRHIDTAQMYGNEAEVGAAVRMSGLRRDEVFVTSKLNNGYHARQDALDAFDRSIERMGIEHLDLFLIHWPLPTIDVDYVETWKAMEEMLASGRVRSIGVSNFQPAHLERLFAETDTKPTVNQVEVHPYFDNTEVRAFDAEHGIATEAWSPIGQGDVLDDPVLNEIGDAVGKSAAQVALRWHIQRGDIVFPKSSNADRIRENIDIFDFELDDEAMTRIDGLDRDARRGPNPDEFDMIPDDA